MKILVLTNTYLPHVGGVANSVSAFVTHYRRRGHQVLVVAPEFEGAHDDEEGVVRIPAIQNFNGSDFSVRLPIPTALFPKLDEFAPDIVHSHHPFLLGDTALRIAAKFQVPIVFTHHTMYERYTHYVPGSSRKLRRFVIRLATGYANLCDHVIAPSESIKQVLHRRGVDSPIHVIPTGIDVSRFAAGDGGRIREALAIPHDAFVIGHAGRLAPEKNLAFLAKAAAYFVQRNPGTHFLVVGSGPSEIALQEAFARLRLENYLHLTGRRTGQDLVDSYHAMDLFAFASKTETQGMVLAEAMAAGLPVIALDAPGAREIVRDRENGRLLGRASAGDLARTFEWYRRLPAAEQRALQESARRTSLEFEEGLCADRALALYEAALSQHARGAQWSDSPWEVALSRIEMEWELVRNRARAAGITRFFGSIKPALLVESIQSRVRRTLSRAEWSIRLLRLPREEAAESPGLVLVQIDGLSRRQLERALKARRMPFLRRLLQREGFRLFSFYSGLPSTTPAVQAELFYGVKAAVPAFSYVEREGSSRRWMTAPESARAVEAKLQAEHEGLLKGGSAYSNIYAGGAAEQRFCPSAFGWQGLLKEANPLSLLAVLIWHAPAVLRGIALMLIELVLAVFDVISGALHGQNLLAELKFIPSRVGVCILLRETCTAGAVVDVTRGVPIVHVNFLGYDEQAHRRGPQSYFAHWTLKGIDHAIRRIWFAAKRSRRRDYQIWIYSDHGQEDVESYREREQRTVAEAVAAALGAPAAPGRDEDPYTDSSELERARWLGGRRIQHLFKDAPRDLDDYSSELKVVAVGPLGHVYLGKPVSAAERAVLAERLVHRARIPLVLYLDEDGRVAARTISGLFRIPEDCGRLFEERLPFFQELGADLEALCNHPDAGDLVISGWQLGRRPLSFPLENGAHGGPGSEETHAFLLMPNSYRRAIGPKQYLRASELRAFAKQHLNRTEKKVLIGAKRLPRLGRLRVMTYNVHSCLGMDNRRLPHRIAEVLARYDPDIVCLQELDVKRRRSGGVDQAQEIAGYLAMEFHFHPSLAIQEERYGNAILSRYPMRHVASGELPTLAGRFNLEPRGVLWTEVELPSGRFQLVNTHLGLIASERALQARLLLGPDWLGHPRCRRRTIFCGDLNSSPGSYVHRAFSRHLRDTQESLRSNRAAKTWTSSYPLRRIDYVYVTQDLEVKKAFVPRSELTRVASDHLPLIVDLALEG